MEYACKYYSNSLGHNKLSSLFIIASPRRARDFTKNLAPQGRAFFQALKFEKLKAPLFPSPRGAVDTNDWCIRLEKHVLNTRIFESLRAHFIHVTLAQPYSKPFFLFSCLYKGSMSLSQQFFRHVRMVPPLPGY